MDAERTKQWQSSINAAQLSCSASLTHAHVQKPSGSCDFNSVIEAAKTALVGASNAVRTEAQAIFQVSEGKVQILGYIGE
jgi:hypothetical protein